MVLLVMSGACGLLAFLAALALQFQLPLWQYLCGLTRMSPDKRANIDIHRLRRRLSILMYVLSAGFLAGFLLLDIKAVPEAILLPLYFLLLLLVYNGIWFFFRHFDRNTYTDAARHAARFFRLLVNLILLFLIFVYYTPGN